MSLFAAVLSALVWFADEAPTGTTASAPAAEVEAATPSATAAPTAEPDAGAAVPAALLGEDTQGEKRALYDAAMADYAAGRCEAAMPPLRTLVASGFRGSDAAMALRACYDQLYGIDGSVEKLRAEIAQNPDDPVAHSNLGIFLTFQGKWEEAQKEITRALQLNPIDVDAKLNLAWWYAQVGQSRAAIREHEAILKAEPGNKRSLIELCTLLAERENDPARALPYCEEHAKGQETNEIAGVTLGLVRMRVGDLDGAEKAFKAVADANPKARTATLSLGHLRQYRGDFDGARAAFEAVLADSPDDAEARLALAHLHTARRDFGAAIENYRLAYDQTHSGMALAGLAKAYLSKYFFLVIGLLLVAMGLLLWRYLNVRVPGPPPAASATA